MTTQADGTSVGGREFQLGVLLVHGIGNPRPGDTLVHWGEVLLKTIERATRTPQVEGQGSLTSPPSTPPGSQGTSWNQVVTTIERAGPGESPGRDCLEATVQLRVGDHTERWLLREGLWAGAFPAPSYRELVSWSVRALPWSIVTHFGERYWQSRSVSSLRPVLIGLLKRPWDRARIAALVKAIREFEPVFQLIIALALTPVLITLLGLTLLLGLVPIPQIRTLVHAVQSTLTATVGDSFAFVESPIRAALIRACILDGLKRLKSLCQHTVVVAHSQGAAVVLDALGGLDPPDEKRDVVPDALVTFGSGANQLASQKELARGVPKTGFVWDPVLGAVVGILGTVGLSLWLFWSTPIEDIVKGVLAVLAALGVLLFCLLLFVWLKERGNATKGGDVKLAGRRLRYAAIIAVTVFVVVIISLVLYGSLWHIPVFPIWFWLFAMVFLFGSIKFILSPSGKKIFRAPVYRPLGLCRWVDLYASADPVPNGRTRTAEGEHESKQIWNLGSLFADHTAYWDNRDGFVLRVARVCAETAESRWKKDLPSEADFVDKRAAWRVGFLGMARSITSLIWLALGMSLWTRYQASVPLPFTLPSWIPEAPVRIALFVALIVVAMWVTSSALRWIWSWWVWAEQKAVLDHEWPGRESDELLLHIVIFCMTAVVFILVYATTYSVFNANSWANFEPSTLYLPIIFAWPSVELLKKLKRPPDSPSFDANSSDRNVPDSDRSNHTSSRESAGEASGG